MWTTGGRAVTLDAGEKFRVTGRFWSGAVRHVGAGEPVARLRRESVTRRPGSVNALVSTATRAIAIVVHHAETGSDEETREEAGAGAACQSPHVTLVTSPCVHRRARLITSHRRRRLLPQPPGTMIRAPLSRLARAGLLTGVVDGAFACVLSAIYNGNATRVWQGVASTLLGPSAMVGGMRTTAVGVLMHFGVAFGWSAVFLALYAASAGLRRRVRSRGGVPAAAAVYGPVIWMVMSLAVIPLLTHRPPSITWRWWLQLLGHIPFVGLPIVWSIGRGAGDRD